MKTRAKYLTIISVVVLWSCNSKEVKREFHSNGKVKSEVEFVEGVRNGFAKYYDENGKIFDIQNYVNDTLSGDRIGFYQNGNIRGKINYNHGLLSGKYELFYEDGTLAESGTYQNGRKRGLIEQFYPGNKLHKRFYLIYFSDLKPHSWWSEEYDSLGNKISEDRNIIVSIDKDSLSVGESATVEFSMLKNEGYDSCFVLVGGYDELFNPIAKLDTIKIINNTGSYVIKAQTRGEYYLRGKWLLYRNESTKDSTYEYQTFNYFEEPIKVY